MSLSQTVFNFIVWGILFTTYSMAQAPIVLTFPFPDHGNAQTLRRELHSKGVVSKPVIIPDRAFRDYCLSLIEASGGTEITSDQMAAIKRISISDSGIASLEGIEYCTGLDVGSNLALQYLDCSKNNLEALNVQHNKKLLLLICADNELESLSVAENYALEYLDCSSNWLTNLDITQSSSLTILNCGGNELTELHISSNDKLLMLCCANNKLAQLDVSSNIVLQSLNCQGNRLIWLDVTGNKDLMQIQCGSNLLTGIKLNTLGLHQSQYLDCANNPQLKELWLKPAQDTTLHTKDAHTRYRWDLPPW